MSTLKVNNLQDLGADAVVTNGVVNASALPAGTILQVVSTTKTDTFTTSSTSFADVTGLSVSITPSSTSSKIYVMGSVTGASTYADGGSRAIVRLVRDATPISIADSAGSRTQATGNVSTRNLSGDFVLTSAFNFLDAPSSTSALSYKIQVATPGGVSLFINRQENDVDSGSVPRTVSSITVMEVAA